MNGEKISRCLDALPDEMLSEAMRPYRPRSLGWHIVRIAACLAIVIGLTIALWPEEETPGAQLETPTEGTTVTPTMPTEVPPETLPKTYFAAPGILKLYSYTQQSVPAEELEKYEVKDGVNTYKPYWMEYNRGMPLTICLPPDYFPRATVTIKLSVDYGYFFSDGLTDCLGKEVTINNGDRIYWKAGGEIDKMKEEINPGIFYMNVLIYADNYVVGYGVIKMHGHQLDGVPYVCYMYSCATMCYPLVDGQFQDISEKYMLDQIQMYKNAYPEVGCSLCSK